ncbi:MAG: DUF4120 domain-containing protein [Lachnospiraceae bacterium]|nr:DUF4120 domain-containing protein [Lachnospiraceae bacterium]MCM1239384.1 DUF4120 domain-containing protein [Lachnospiraceae bacterium]
MGQRTMMKLSASENCVFVWTVSRGFRSPHRFGISKQELRTLEEERHIIASDIHSFADLRLGQSGRGEPGDMLDVEFTWLSDNGGRMVSGREETLHMPYRKFREAVEKSEQIGGASVELLSSEEKPAPRIEFQSRKNLRAVTEVKILRKKLGRFLNAHFAWKGSRKIVVYDDFEPYSFFFIEETPRGAGICGGIILHGREDLRKAYYGIHT